MKKTLIALGGNALLRREERGTVEEQIRTIKSTCKQIGQIVEEGYLPIITTGNAPQVGAIALQNEIAKDQVPPMPLDVLGAESQGLIGYLLQQQLKIESKKKGLNVPVITVLTQVLVDKGDPAFKNPTKPIGPFYEKEEAARLKRKRGWVFKKLREGWRRVVPSPEPKKIIEEKAIKKLVNAGAIIIACGGGGIPVIRKGRELKGVEAVIDKDLASEVLATAVRAKLFLNLTDVDQVYLNYGKLDEKPLDYLTVKEAKKYLNQGQFPPGSMGPKVRACIRFIRNGGEKAIISSLEKGKLALGGKAGTLIRGDPINRSDK